MMIQSKKSQGFSLVELMAVVAIIGVLGAVVYPSYVQSVRKTNRAEAKSELSDAAQRFQRCFTVHGRFEPASGCAVYDSLKNGGTYTTNGQGFYEIKLDTTTTITATTFKLVATAIKLPQTKDTKDGCNILTLDQNAQKTPAACW